MKNKDLGEAKGVLGEPPKYADDMASMRFGIEDGLESAAIRGLEALRTRPKPQKGKSLQNFNGELKRTPVEKLAVNEDILEEI